jgi:hypothetical protein
MVQISLFPHGEGMLRDVDQTTLLEATDLRMGCLQQGTVGGAPSVAITCQLPDGRHVMVQTTLKLLQGAVAAFVAVHGDWLGAPPSGGSFGTGKRH